MTIELDQMRVAAMSVDRRILQELETRRVGMSLLELIAAVEGYRDATQVGLLLTLEQLQSDGDRSLRRRYTEALDALIAQGVAVAVEARGITYYASKKAYDEAAGG